MTNLNNLKSELSMPLEEPLETNSGNKENLCWSDQTYVPKTLYPSQITYGFTIILNRLFDTSKHSDQNIDGIDIPSSLAWFTSIWVL